MSVSCHDEKRNIPVLSLLLTSLLAELLGQRILKNDLSSMCCCGSGKEKDRREKVKERKIIKINTTRGKVNWLSLLYWLKIDRAQMASFPILPKCVSQFYMKEHFFNTIIMIWLWDKSKKLIHKVKISILKTIPETKSAHEKFSEALIFQQY